MLGRGPTIAAWITISLRSDGTLVPMDREWNPSFNPILNPDDIKDEFNATDPVDDVKNHLQPESWVDRLFGRFSVAWSRSAAC
jgi:hypothetical protein